MNSNNPQGGSHFNPFIKHATSGTASSIPDTTSNANPTNVTPFQRGQMPPVPNSSQSAPPPPFSYQQPGYPGGVPPPPGGVTPFMPRTGAVLSAPPTSTLPHPPTSQTPLSQDPAKYSTHTAGGHHRQGITAAQLYSLNVIGSEIPVSRPPIPGAIHGAQGASGAAEGAAGAGSQDSAQPAGQSEPKESKPQKPSNSNDVINLNRIPHPEEDDRLRVYTWEKDDDWISTLPYPTYQYQFIDTGITSPRYMRSTLRVLPQSYYMLNKTKIPCSVFVTPFATPHPSEAPIPLVNGMEGIVRCSECNAYMNPWMRFVDDGYHYICNICGQRNPTPTWYYSTLDPAGKRYDRSERPELSKGTVDFIVGSEYAAHEPQPLRYIFVMDGTWKGVSSGVLDASLQAMEACLEVLKEEEKAELGFCVFDTVVHVIVERNGHIHEICMADSEDAYAVTDYTTWLLPPSTRSDSLRNILQYIRRTFLPPNPNQPQGPTGGAMGSSIGQGSSYGCCTAAVRTAVGALSSCGGHVTLVECSAPLLGVGRVSSNEVLNLYGTDDESQLYLRSQDESFYSQLGLLCGSQDISVDIAIITDGHVHLAEQLPLPYRTGGSIRCFQPSPSGLAELHGFLQSVVLESHARETIGKLRVSGGLKVNGVRGGGILSSDSEENDEPMMACMTHHATWEFQLDFPKYVEGDDVFLQFAVLYTNDEGKRRLRVFNQKLQTTATYPRLFKGLDGTAVMMSLARTAAEDMDSVRLPEVREKLEGTVETILTQYRAECSASSSNGQLVLPENGKLFPLFANCLLKSPLLLLNEAGKRGLDAVCPRGDTRAWAIERVSEASPTQFIDFVYPVLYRLDPEKPWGFEENGFLKKPEYQFLTEAALDLGYVFLMSGWRGLMFIVSNHVPSEVLQSLFGVDAVVDQQMAGSLMLQPEGDEFNQRVNLLVGELQNQLGCYLQPRVILRGTQEASMVMEMMTEDLIRKESSFSDYLRHLHSNIIMNM